MHESVFYFVVWIIFLFFTLQVAKKMIPKKFKNMRELGEEPEFVLQMDDDYPSNLSYVSYVKKLLEQLKSKLFFIWHLCFMLWRWNLSVGHLHVY